MTATIEVKQGVNCHYLELRGQAICDMIDALPVGLCRMIPDARVKELEANYELLSDDYKQAELSNTNLRVELAAAKEEIERLRKLIPNDIYDNRIWPND